MSDMRTRVVVCDDEPITRMDIREMLLEAGYLVVGEAGDGASGVELCRTLRPDLLVLDIKMPGMDGITAAKTLARELGADVPAIVMVTAYRQKDLVEDAAGTCINAYLLKPISQAQLVASVEVALTRRQELREVQGRIETLDSKLRARKVIERAKGLLMSKRGWTEDQAFTALRSVSMGLRVPLAEVARMVVAGQVVEGLLER